MRYKGALLVALIVCAVLIAGCSSPTSSPTPANPPAITTSSSSAGYGYSPMGAGVEVPKSRFVAVTVSQAGDSTGVATYQGGSDSASLAVDRDLRQLRSPGSHRVCNDAGSRSAERRPERFHARAGPRRLRSATSSTGRIRSSWIPSSNPFFITLSALRGLSRRPLPPRTVHPSLPPPRTAGPAGNPAPPPKPERIYQDRVKGPAVCRTGAPTARRRERRPGPAPSR